MAYVQAKLTNVNLCHVTAVGKPGHEWFPAVSEQIAFIGDYSVSISVLKNWQNFHEDPVTTCQIQSLSGTICMVLCN